MGRGHGIGVTRNDYHRRNRRRNISMHKRSSGRNVNNQNAELVANTEFIIPEIDRETLINCARLNQKKVARSTDYVKDKSDETACVDYIKHKLTSYDILARYAKGATYLLLIQKIYTAIADAYPWLGQECARQYAQKTQRRTSSGIRIIKQRPPSLTQLQIEEMNARDEKTFSGIPDEEDESMDYNYDAALSSLDSSRLIYFPPFLKRDEIAARRFASGEDANDRWWEWEEERGIKTTNGRPHFIKE